MDEKPFPTLRVNRIGFADGKLVCLPTEIRSRKALDDVYREQMDISLDALSHANEVVDRAIEIENNKFLKEDTSMKDYGTFDHQGKPYRLTADAQPTSRCLPQNLGKNDYFEMSAPAIGPDGKRHEVFWVFETKPDWELDMYDYDDVDRVECLDE